MNRRSFLAGASTAAGAALLTPWFRQALAGGPAPTRFVFVVEGNGYEPVTMMSTATRAAIDAATTLDTSGRRWFPTYYQHTAPLVVQQGDLGTAPALDPLLPGSTGIDLTTKASVTLGLSSTVTGGGHTTNFGALSCTRSTPGRAGGPTIDALLAAVPEVRQQAPFDAVRVGVHASTNALNNSTCAYAEGRAAPVLMDPVLAYNNLFGSVADLAGQEAFARRADLLSYARTDVNAALAQFGGNTTERQKLETYLASLEALTDRQQQLTALAPTLAGVAPEAPSTNPLYASADPLDHLQAQFDLVNAALLGGLTNVAVIASGTGGAFDLAYPSLIADIGRHNLQHGAADPTYLSVIHAATRRHVEMIAKLARSLHSTPEGGGTMLDNTVIVYLSDNGESHHSSAEEWPVLMVGGQGLGFLNDGRSTVFPGVRQSTNRQLSNLFNTLGYAAGLTLDDFGAEGSSRIAPGPLSELRT
ncbi:MAG: DUF1552 domain-containing protein [Myxococcota bacterium]